MINEFLDSIVITFSCSYINKIQKINLKRIISAYTHSILISQRVINYLFEITY